MKKMCLFLALAMAVAFCGTALAANTVELYTATSGVSEVYWGPVFTSGPGGTSAYVLTRGIFEPAATKPGQTGTTLYAISGTENNTAGTEMFSRALKYMAGCTPIGGPQLISGTTNTVVVYVQAPANQTVGNSADSGATLFIVNGLSGADIKNPIGIPFTGAGVALVGALGAGNYSTAPVTIDSENTSYSGATIYGVSGVSIAAGGGVRGVSVWGISAQTGAYALTPSQSNVTSFVATGNNGVSVVTAAPVVSGTSLFVVGWNQTTAGNTIYQFAKNNIYNGITASAAIDTNRTVSDKWVPTPCVAGNSIFVVDNHGGVSSYRVDNLSRNYGFSYVGASTAARGGVTASPVTDGTYIVLCATSSVTNYRLSELNTGTKKWTYDFGANKSIWATPVISNGFVWVVVNDLILNTSTTYRFTLDSTTGGIQTVETFGQLTFADPIIVDGHLWTVSFDPTVRKVAAPGADGIGYWPQFKFDKGKTGHNTASHPTIFPGDDDSTCFISTVK